MLKPIHKVYFVYSSWQPSFKIITKLCLKGFTYDNTCHVKIPSFEGVYLVQMVQRVQNCLLNLSHGHKWVLCFSNIFSNPSSTMTMLIPVLMEEEVISWYLWNCWWKDRGWKQMENVTEFAQSCPYHEKTCFFEGWA